MAADELKKPSPRHAWVRLAFVYAIRKGPDSKAYRAWALLWKRGHVLRVRRQQKIETWSGKPTLASMKISGAARSSEPIPKVLYAAAETGSVLREGDTLYSVGLTDAPFRRPLGQETYTGLHVYGFDVAEVPGPDDWRNKSASRWFLKDRPLAELAKVKETPWDLESVKDLLPNFLSEHYPWLEGDALYSVALDLNWGP